MAESGKSTARVPRYRRQKRAKRTDIAFVELGSTRHYLGTWGSDESHERYARMIAEWRASHGRLPIAQTEITVVEMTAGFWTHAEGYYRKPNGDTTSELEQFRLALRPLEHLYGRSRAAEFGPLKLRAVRERMIEIGWSRTYINRQVGRLKRVFKWAAGEEMIPPTVYHGLAAVGGLKRGRTEAREIEPIKPVPDSIVDATLQHMTPTLRAMVETQRLSGMRPGEVCMMRTGDLDMSGSVWVYQPEFHKTQHHGRKRLVYLGPKAQDILRPFLRGDPTRYLFSPIESEDQRRETMHKARETPLSCGNRPGSNRKRHPKWGPNDRYSADTFKKAIAYACKRAFPTPDGLVGDNLKAWHRDHSWSPNRLRHSFATKIRRSHGLEASQVLLGHVHAAVTEVYAERDQGRALEVIRKIG